MPSRKGSQNKNKDRLLRTIQEEFPNYNPLLELVKIANSEEATTAEKITCNKEVAQYVNPKLKAVEHSGDMTVNHVPLTKEELKQRISRYKKDKE